MEGVSGKRCQNPPIINWRAKPVIEANSSPDMTHPMLLDLNQLKTCITVIICMPPCTDNVVNVIISYE